MKRKDISTTDVLQACKDFHESGGPAPWCALMSKLGAPEKLVYRAMERDCDAGLIDYGVSLRTAWVTDKGNQYLYNQSPPGHNEDG